MLFFWFLKFEMILGYSMEEGYFSSLSISLRIPLVIDMDLRVVAAVPRSP